MKRLKDMPSPPILSFAGHGKAFGKSDFHLQLLDWSKEYGDIYRLRLGWLHVVVVSEPSLIKSILNSRPEKYQRTSKIEKILSELDINGVFSANGDRWKQQRQIVERAFKTDYIKGFYPQLSVITSRLVKHFEHLAETGEVVDILSEFKRFTLDVTIWLAFGKDFNSIEKGTSEFETHIGKIFSGIFRRLSSAFPYWHYYKSAKDKQLELASKKITEEVEILIKEQRNKLLNNDNLMLEPENLIQALLAVQFKTNELSDADILANCVTILLAGEDTTANTLAWMSIFISENADISDALFKELFDKTETGLFDWPLPKLPYLNAIINESMRLKPVAPFIVVQNINDENIAEYQVNSGTMIYLLLQSNGLNSSFYHAAEKFDPQRWLQDEDKASLASIHPFGGGKRICPGRWLALLEIRLVIAAIFRNFYLQSQQPITDISDHLSFTLSPKGFYCKVRKR